MARGGVDMNIITPRIMMLAEVLQSVVKRSAILEVKGELCFGVDK